MCFSHSNLELTIVNTYALLYVWKGSDSSLKPLLLTAHQGEFISVSCTRYTDNTPLDVVPVLNTTIDEWQHPPFSGYFDGLYSVFILSSIFLTDTLAGDKIWGRGSCDDKSGLIGSVLTSVFDP